MLSTSTLLVMVLPGVPAFYLPALLAEPNDLSRFRRTGQRRDLNRPQFKLEAVERRDVVSPRIGDGRRR